MIELQNFNIAWNSPQVFLHIFLDNIAQDISHKISHSISHNIQQAKTFVNDSAIEMGESLKTTANTATDTVINTLSNNTQQAQGVLKETFQNTIAYSLSGWLEDYPGLIKILNILGWGANHPIISFIIFLFSLAIIWSIIKAIGRVIETASWSILKIPFQLILALVKVSAVYFTKIARFAVTQFTETKTSDAPLALTVASFEPIIPDKQQRITEISARLEELQKEQNQLLQEAAELMSKDTINHKIPLT
jgi:hypothetical protein